MFRRIALLAGEDSDFFGISVAGEAVLGVHEQPLSAEGLRQYVSGFVRNGKDPVCPFDNTADCAAFRSAADQLGVSLEPLSSEDKYGDDNFRHCLQLGQFSDALALVDVMCQNDRDESRLEQFLDIDFKAYFDRTLGPDPDAVAQLESYFNILISLEVGADDDQECGPAGRFRGALFDRCLDVLLGAGQSICHDRLKSSSSSILFKLLMVFEYADNRSQQMTQCLSEFSSRCLKDSKHLSAYIPSVLTMSVVLSSNTDLTPLLHALFAENREAMVNKTLLIDWVILHGDSNLIFYTAENMPVEWLFNYERLDSLLIAKDNPDIIGIQNEFVFWEKMVTRLDEAHLTCSIVCQSIETKLLHQLNVNPAFKDVAEAAFAKVHPN